MPGPQRQVLNQDVVGGGKGRKKVSDPVAIESKSVRRIRLLLNDPDATDSSGDEENGDPVLYIKKRIVHEIPLVPLRQKSVPSPSSSPYPICAPRNLDTLRTLKLRRVAPSESSSRFKGVRQRRWGKWAAEIRDPIRGIRKWLGTYDSAEEAAKAYQEAFRRIQAEKLRLQHPCAPAPTSPASSSISERTISLSSPSSVLDVSAPVISSAQRRPADLLLAPQVEGFEERPISDLFGQHHLVPGELDFSLGVESDELLVGNLDDDFIGLGDLPLWAPQFDGGDLAFLD